MPLAVLNAVLHQQCRPAAAMVLTFAAVTLWAAPVAAQSTLRFVDQNNQALRDVVVWTQHGAPAERTASASAGPQPSRAAPRQEIDQQNKRFAPYVSVVEPGTDVFFPNSDDIRHHVYSFSTGNAFERKLYRANEADPVRLENQGIVALGCNIHDNMQAYIVVSDEAVLLSDVTGQLSIPVETQQLRIWHPLLGNNTLDAHLSDFEAVAKNRYVFHMPFVWSDPQTPRSDAQLESLLKQFSRDTQ